MISFKKACDENYFGQPKTGFKFNAIDSLGWVKWPNGNRVYYTYKKAEPKTIIIVLVAGNKNDQQKDILEAKKVIEELGNEQSKD